MFDDVSEKKGKKKIKSKENVVSLQLNMRFPQT